MTSTARSEAGNARPRPVRAAFDPPETKRSTRPYSPRARGRISDYAYEELLESIRSLDLPPGAPLSEPGVAAWLDVSRAPVREAFTRLADQRLIEIVPQVGSRVAPISMADVSDAAFVRCALETAAFRQAIARDDLDLTEIERVVRLNREAFDRGDNEEFFKTDENLHQLVFALAGVPHMWELVHGMKVHLDRLRRLTLTRNIENSDLPREHELIVRAIRDRDEATGVSVIDTHAHRVLTDTQRLRSEYPEYFAL